MPSERMEIDGHSYDLFSQACVEALRLRAERAEARAKEFEAANQGWQMVEDERAAFVAAAEERVAALAPFVDEIAARPCENGGVAVTSPEDKPLTGGKV